MLRWAAVTRRRHRLLGAVIRPAVPLLPERPAPVEPIFILGSPRSGTTTLFQLLDRSQRLASLGRESNMLWEMFHRPEHRGFRSHALGPGDVTARERRAVLWMIDCITGGVRYLDKYPRLCLRVEYLHALFPDAWFVYITRDGRAAVSSLITGWRATDRFRPGTRLPRPMHIGGYGGDIWKFLLPPGWEEYVDGRPLADVCAFQWREANRAVLDAREHIGDARFIQLRYEDLIAEPEVSTRRLMEKLRMAPDPEVMSYAATLGLRVSRTAVTPPRPDKWRDENPAEIDAVLDAIAPMMRRLGYDPES